MHPGTDPYIQTSAVEHAADGFGARASRHSLASLAGVRVIDVALTAVVFVVALAVFWSAAHSASYHPDESDYIWTSRYFDYLVVSRDLDNEAWDDNLWTHTQPMMTRYLIGGWLWVRGHNLSTLPAPSYDWGKTYEENQQAGHVPEDWLLFESRVPSVVLAAGSAVLLYWLGGMIAGPLAGVVAALLLLGNPLMREHIVRAIPEPALMFFLLLALWLAAVGTRRGTSGGLPAVWALGSGVALGLAMQSKLTATFSVAAFGIWALAVVALAAWRRHAGGHTTWREVGRIAGSWAVVFGVAALVFVATNPHLYPNPVEHTIHLFRERTTTMNIQHDGNPHDATGGLADRVSYVTGGSLVVQPGLEEDHTRVWRGLPLALLLAPAGVWVLARRSWRCWRGSGVLPAEALVLLTTLAYFGGIAVTLHVYWSRYILPSYMLGGLLAGIGAGAIVRWIVPRWRARRSSSAT